MFGRVLREAAPADRWAANILANSCYSCFDDGYRQAILATRLVDLPFVLAVKADPRAVRSHRFRLDGSIGEEGT